MSEVAIEDFPSQVLFSLSTIIANRTYTSPIILSPAMRLHILYILLLPLANQAHRHPASQVHRHPGSQAHKHTASQAHKRPTSRAHRPLASQATAPSYQVCAHINPEVSLAIWDFCLNRDIMVPSDYASQYQHGDVTIGIDGTCEPPQLVRQDECRDRFFKMCAQSKYAVFVSKQFGRNRCQTWRIHRGSAA